MTKMEAFYALRDGRCFDCGDHLDGEALIVQIGEGPTQYLCKSCQCGDLMWCGDCGNLWLACDQRNPEVCLNCTSIDSYDICGDFHTIDEAQKCPA